MFEEKYNNLTGAEKENFKRITSLLLNRTFMVNRFYDKNQGTFRSNSDYRFIDRNIDLFREYLEIAGYRLLKDSNYEVIYIENEYEYNKKRLDKNTTIFLYGLRLKFDEDTLTELAESIKKYGVIQPIVVKKVEDHYQIIAGERRWRAAKQAGLKDIPVIIKDYDEQQIAEIALIENLQREDLNPIEEAKAYQSLIEKYQLKQEEIAEKVFKSRSVITNALRLLKLDEEVQLMLMEGKITNGHAKAVLGLEDKEEQRAVAQKVVEEQLSVRDTEKYIKSLLDKKNEPAVTKPVLKNQTLYETLESRMKSRMGTKVQIKRKSDDKGKIEIDYYSNDDLERIIELMGITKDTIE